MSAENTDLVDFFEKAGSKKKMNPLRRGSREVAPSSPSSGDVDEITHSFNEDAERRWAANDVKFWACSATYDTLPPGLYKPMHSDQVGFYLEQQNIDTDDLLILPDTSSESILQEIEQFWGLREKFEERGFIHKRGVLLWGDPGCLPASAMVKIRIDDERQTLCMITIGKLRQLLYSGNTDTVYVDTPDGWQPIINWFDRGMLPMVRIRTVLGLETYCSTKHLIETISTDGTVNEQRRLWTPAGTLQKNCPIRVDATRTGGIGVDRISSIEPAGEAECFDFEVGHENHRYWGDGFSSHNCGKTATINILVNTLIKNGGIAIFVGHPRITTSCLQMIRRIEPERPIIAIMEDFETLIEEFNEAEYLAMLDGESQVGYVAFIATTNYPERLDKRFIDRPSRFDTIKKLRMPTPDARRFYLSRKEPSLVGDELEHWVKVSDGFSIAHLKEMIVSNRLYGKPIEKVVERLNSMRDRKISSNQALDDRSSFGFNKQ